MKGIHFNFLFLFSLICFISCNQKSVSNLKNIQLRYIFEGNNLQSTSGATSTIEFINQSDTSIGADWELYFNQITPNVETITSDQLNITKVNGDLYKIWPKPEFSLKGHDTARIKLATASPSIKYTDFPSGFYFVNTNSKVLTKVEDLSISVPPLGDKWMRSEEDLIPIPDANHYFQVNESKINKNSFPHSIIPRPKKVISTNKKISFTHVKIEDNPVFASEIDFLNREIENLFPGLNGNRTLNIEVIHNPNLRLSKINDDYTLTIRNQSAKIEASNAKAAFYGIMSLLQLLDPSEYGSRSATLPEVSISDYPALEYRGFMLDVGRNFKSKEQVMWVIDLLSRYKMNVFHFHITDDEGWRLEIEDLPELTNYGAYRGYSDNEEKYLYPAYGSGPFATPSQVSGFYTKKDFIEILEYAKTRHIQVIPEIDMPGHARAAVRSMEQRYHTYKDSDPEKANEYLLSDINDASQYSSIQQYTDNVINVCKPSTYVFFEKIVTDLKQYYQEAGLSLDILHIGGDEVPKGVWTASPECDQWLQENNLKQDYLMQDFLERINAILTSNNITMGGWQEIALSADHSIDVNQSGKMIPYVWNTMPGDPDSPDDSQELAYKLANNGFEIVISSAPNLYFDFAYDKHPDEPGFYWSGFIDLQTSFSMQPYDMYTSYSKDPMGHDLSQDHSKKEKLVQKENILGIQGQLWNETVHNFSALQYYLIPKIFGLFERAWNPDPIWQGQLQSNAFNEDWESFRYNVGKYQIPMLKSISNHPLNYRLSPPGGIIKDGELHANAYWPSVEIKYTTDGSEPDRNSKTYTQPITLSNDFKNIQLKAFDADGYSSRTIKLEVKK